MPWFSVYAARHGNSRLRIEGVFELFSVQLWHGRRRAIFGREGGDFFVKDGGHLFAIQAALDWFAEDDGRVDFLLGEKFEKMGTEGHVAPITDVVGDTAFSFVKPIVDPGWRYRPIGFGGGFQKG